MTPKGKPKGKSKAPSSTIINLVIDQSSSMTPLQRTVISSFNEYINTCKKDKKASDKMLVSVTTFDTLVDTKKKYDLSPIEDVKDFTMEDYQPRGSTALYDALGHSMSYVDQKLSTQRRKPAVLFVIITDGEENASREYTQEKIKQMIKEREAKGNYQFIYLGANHDAWQAGQNLGVQAQNSAMFTSSESGMKNTMGAMAMATSNFNNSVRGNVMMASSFRAFSSDKSIIADDVQHDKIQKHYRGMNLDADASVKSSTIQPSGTGNLKPEKRGDFMTDLLS